LTIREEFAKFEWLLDAINAHASAVYLAVSISNCKDPGVKIYFDSAKKVYVMEMSALSDFEYPIERAARMRKNASK